MPISQARNPSPGKARLPKATALVRKRNAERKVFRVPDDIPAAIARKEAEREAQLAKFCCEDRMNLAFTLEICLVVTIRQHDPKLSPSKAKAEAAHLTDRVLKFSPCPCRHAKSQG